MPRRRRNKDRLDEILLAAALAAANARGFGHCTGARFKDARGNQVKHPSKAASCGALGALEIAGKVESKGALPRDLLDTWRGNDREGVWMSGYADRGESLGWAFRCAMEAA